MGPRPGRTNRDGATRTLLPYVWGIVILVAVVVAFRFLPRRYANAVVPAATFLLFLATGGLVAATWFYARRTDESLRVMEKQTRAVELQVEAADRQRRAMIRPVIMFRNDFAEPEVVARHDADLKLWEDAHRAAQQARHSALKSALFPGEKPRAPGAGLVNVGNGVALNVRAWAAIDDGKRLCQQAASIGEGESHFVRDWYPDLQPGKAVLTFAATYEDAEGTAYYTVLQGAATDGTWRVGEGPLPAEFATAESEPAALDTA